MTKLRLPAGHCPSATITSQCAVALMRKAGQGKDEKMEVLFNFLTGPEFRNRVQAITETFFINTEG